MNQQHRETQENGGDTTMLSNDAPNSEEESEIQYISVPYLKSIRNALINSPVFRQDDSKQPTEDEIAMWEVKGLASLPESLWEIILGLEDTKISDDILKLISGLSALYCRNTEGKYVLQVKLEAKNEMDLTIDMKQPVIKTDMKYAEYEYDLANVTKELAVLKQDFAEYDVLNRQQMMKISCLRKNGLLLEATEEELFAYYTFIENGNTKLSCPYD